MFCARCAGMPFYAAAAAAAVRSFDGCVVGSNRAVSGICWFAGAIVCMHAFYLAGFVWMVYLHTNTKTHAHTPASERVIFTLPILCHC